MNQNVLLCCQDLVFSRMLDLELSALHLTVRRFEGVPDRFQWLMEKAGLLIFDTELLRNIAELCEKTAKAGVPLILFGRSAPEQLPVNPSVTFIRRPFPVGSFLNTVRQFIGYEEDETCGALTRNREFKSGPVADLIRLDEETRSAFFADDHLHLTGHEYNLLSYFLHNKGRVISREEILTHVFGGSDNENAVNVYVRYLRKKIDERYSVHFICSVRGEGYTVHDS